MFFFLIFFQGVPYNERNGMSSLYKLQVFNSHIIQNSMFFIIVHAFKCNVFPSAGRYQYSQLCRSTWASCEYYITKQCNTLLLQCNIVTWCKSWKREADSIGSSAFLCSHIQPSSTLPYPHPVSLPPIPTLPIPLQETR